MRRNTIAVITVAAFTMAFPAHAAEIVVDPPANDSANDVLESALGRAVPGDRVVLRGGEFRLDRPINFPRSGEERRPITLCAAPGEYIALLGSVRLVGWQRHQGKIWKVKHPAKLVKGLYEDSERLTHTRPHWGKREDPPASELKAPGTWTQDAQWVYLWSRESDSPDTHRIEASQHPVMNVNQPWIRVEGLHLLFGQHVACQITADHCEVVRCEIAHCSNSVDNSYNAYFSGCSNSAFRHCQMHESFYWGDHGSNSHTTSAINCGDDGPNFVDRCEIFNGGLGVGSKGAVRELVVMDCHIYDQVNGIAVSGERSSGPGAGKTDRLYVPKGLPPTAQHNQRHSRRGPVPHQVVIALEALLVRRPVTHHVAQRHEDVVADREVGTLPVGWSGDGNHRVVAYLRALASERSWRQHASRATDC